MPNLPPSGDSRAEPILVGFAGRMGAGKTSAARYLGSAYGFQYTRYSQVLHEWLGQGVSDQNQLQKLGWGVMAGGQQRELNSRLIAGLDPSCSAAIDGLRHRIDFESLSSAFQASFTMIFLEASAAVRFERLRSRFATYDEFALADAQPVEGYIEDLKPLASMIISTDDPLEALYQRLDTCIAARITGERK